MVVYLGLSAFLVFEALLALLLSSTWPPIRNLGMPVASLMKTHSGIVIMRTFHVVLAVVALGSVTSSFMSYKVVANAAVKTPGVVPHEAKFGWLQDVVQAALSGFCAMFMHLITSLHNLQKGIDVHKADVENFRKQADTLKSEYSRIASGDTTLGEALEEALGVTQKKETQTGNTLVGNAMGALGLGGAEGNQATGADQAAKLMNPSGDSEVLLKGAAVAAGDTEGMDTDARVSLLKGEVKMLLYKVEALEERNQSLEEELVNHAKEAKSAEANASAVMKQAEGMRVEMDRVLDENTNLRAQLSQFDRTFADSAMKKAA